MIESKNTIRLLPGDLIEVALTQGRVAICDLADLPLIAPLRWCAVRTRRKGSQYERWYVTTGATKQRPRLYLHTYLTGYALTDHINGDGLDNRRGNLREATHKQNIRNARISTANTSGYRGVWYDRHNGGHRWVAHIKVDRRIHYLGRFHTPEEAARAYDAAAQEHFGEFANVNFPPLRAVVGAQGDGT